MLREKPPEGAKLDGAAGAEEMMPGTEEGAAEAEAGEPLGAPEAGAEEAPALPLATATLPPPLNGISVCFIETAPLMRVGPGIL